MQVLVTLTPARTEDRLRNSFFRLLVKTSHPNLLCLLVTCPPLRCKLVLETAVWEGQDVEVKGGIVKGEKV